MLLSSLKKQKMSHILKISITILTLIFLTTIFCLGTHDNTPIYFRNLKANHQAKILNNDEVKKIAELTNLTNINELLDNICIERPVGSENHKLVNNYIKEKMASLDWHIETDKFIATTPVGNQHFENIITKLNKDASRYLTLACHYDSKIMNNFVGATDSAVPCSQMINLAFVMKKYLEPLKQTDVSLMFIFFDGEEAFVEWSSRDSIYGAKNLAKKWHSTSVNYGYDETDLTELDKIDIMVLLDLLGARDPGFYNYFENTKSWYQQMMRAEQVLADNRLFKKYNYDSSRNYFKGYTINARIEDDHLPFLERDVPILHVIPGPFPKVWHTSQDNRRNIDLDTIENLNKIFRVFVASYFYLDI